LFAEGQAHDMESLRLGHLVAAHPESVAEGHCDGSELLEPPVGFGQTPHVERPWRTPGELHVQPVIVPLPAGACQVVGVDPHGRALRGTYDRPPRDGGSLDARWERLSELMDQEEQRQNRRHARESTLYERTPSNGLLHGD